MPCLKIDNAIICYNNVYRYKGYYFEWHNYFGTYPLKKNGDVRQNIPKGFWDMVEDFQKLKDKEKQKYIDNSM